MAFTPAFNSLYANYAYNLHLARESFATAATFAAVSRDVVVNVITNTESIAGEDDAHLIELALLSTINSTVNSIEGSDSSLSMLAAVRQFNNYVISKSTLSGTSAEKLRDYVNNDVPWASVSGESCIPFYWCVLCSDAGYDITTWDCCAIS